MKRAKRLRIGSPRLSSIGWPVSSKDYRLWWISIRARDFCLRPVRNKVPVFPLPVCSIFMLLLAVVVISYWHAEQYIDRQDWMKTLNRAHKAGYKGELRSGGQTRLLEKAEEMEDEMSESLATRTWNSLLAHDGQVACFFCAIGLKLKLDTFKSGSNRLSIVNIYWCWTSCYELCDDLLLKGLLSNKDARQHIRTKITCHSRNAYITIITINNSYDPDHDQWARVKQDTGRESGVSNRLPSFAMHQYRLLATGRTQDTGPMDLVYHLARVVGSDLEPLLLIVK